MRKPSIVTGSEVVYDGMRFKLTSSRRYKTSGLLSASLGDGSTVAWTIRAPESKYALVKRLWINSSSDCGNVHTDVYIQGETVADAGTGLSQAQPKYSLEGLTLNYVMINTETLTGTLTNNSGGALANLRLSAEYVLLEPA